MNSSKVSQALTNRLFTDLTLILDDGVDKIILEVHKLVLYSNCRYFESLLTNCREKTSNEITMKVINAAITRDIIMSFYGFDTKLAINDWKYQLNLIKCRDYLDLDIDIDYLKNAKIPEQGFELLLDVVDAIGYNQETIRILVKNFPENYNLKLLPRDLLQEIVKIETSVKIITITFDKIQIWNEKGEITGVIYTSYFINCATISNNGKMIATGHKKITIYDTDSAESIGVFADGIIAKLTFSSDDTKIAFINYNGSLLELWNVCESKQIHIWKAKNDENIYQIIFSPDDIMLAIYYSNDRIEIWNITEMKLLITIVENNNVYDMKFSNDCSHLVYGSGNNIRMIEIKTNHSKFFATGHDENIYSLDLSCDNYLVCAFGCCINIFNRSEQYKKIFEIIEKDAIHNVKLFPCGQKIMYQIHPFTIVFDFVTRKRLFELSESFGLTSKLLSGPILTPLGAKIKKYLA